MSFASFLIQPWSSKIGTWNKGHKQGFDILWYHWRYHAGFIKWTHLYNAGFLTLFYKYSTVFLQNMHNFAYFHKVWSKSILNLQLKKIGDFFGFFYLPNDECKWDSNRYSNSICFLVPGKQRKWYNFRWGETSHYQW